MGLVTAWTIVALLVPQPGEVIDRVLAIVAGDVITQSDVLLARDLQLVSTGSGTDPTRADPHGAHRAGARPERGRALCASRARARRDRSAHPGRSATRFQTPEAFAAALARAGLEDAHLREVLRQDLRIDAYLGERFRRPGRDALVRDWIAGLRRRSDVVDLYKP